MSVAATPMTAEELLSLPDRMRHELVHGELRTMPPAGRKHGLIETLILGALWKFVTEWKLGIVTTGDTGYRITRNPDTVLAPDVGFIQMSRVAGVPDDAIYWPFAPDLAVEILSPSDSASDVFEKIGEWLEAAARLVWVIDPEKKLVTVHAPNRAAQTLRRDQHLSGEDVLPGFELAIAEIFR